jgi:predicted nucleotidyltransferase
MRSRGENTPHITFSQEEGDRIPQKDGFGGMAPESVMSLLKRILEKKERRKARLQAALDSLVKELAALGAIRIVLFGSFARRDVDISSDLDLLVIMPPERTGREWQNLIYETVERTAAADIIVFNEREFRENLPRSTFLRNAMKGRVVYEKAA